MTRTFIAAPFVLIALAAFWAPSTAAAQQKLKECGEPPMATPNVPSGKALTGEQIRTARSDVLAYSSKVDEYLSCMDARGNVLFTYMTEDQRTRFNNDLASLHDVRREVQIKMNEAIRAYRQQARNN